MKKRTKEEQAEYMRGYRLKRSALVTPSGNTCVTPIKKDVAPPLVSPCNVCPVLQEEIKQLRAKIVLPEKVIHRRADKESGSIKKIANDLFTRNIAAKNDRFKKIGLMAHAVIILLIAGCTTSAPYIVKSETVGGVKTETVCTHKTYLIPWYIGVAAGFFAFKGDKVCEDKRVE